MIIRNINMILKVLLIMLLIGSMEWMSLINSNYVKLLYVLTFLILIFQKILIKRDLTFNKYILIIIIFLTLNTFYLSSDLFDKIQTIIYIFIISTTFYLLIYLVDLKKFMRVFIKTVYYLSAFAIFQEIVFQLNSNIILFHNATFDKPDICCGILRIQAIFNEPNHFAVFLLPVLFIGLYSLLKEDIGLIKKNEFFIILVAFFLTLSTSGFLGLFLIIFVLLFHIRISIKQVSVLFIITTIITVMIVNSNFISRKFISAFDISIVERNNKPTSGLGIIFGYESVLLTLNTKPIFGYGNENYKTVEKELIDTKYNHIKFLNNKGASDGIGYFKSVVEFGLFGSILFIFILIKNTIGRQRNSSIFIVVNHASLIYLLVMPIRFGQFTYAALWFYFILFIVSKQQYKRLEK